MIRTSLRYDILESAMEHTISLIRKVLILRLGISSLLTYYPNLGRRPSIPRSTQKCIRDMAAIHSHRSSHCRNVGPGRPIPTRSRPATQIADRARQPFEAYAKTKSILKDFCTRIQIITVHYYERQYSYSIFSAALECMYIRIHV